jgi:hypothetical protein
MIVQILSRFILAIDKSLQHVLRLQDWLAFKRQVHTFSAFEGRFLLDWINTLSTLQIDSLDNITKSTRFCKPCFISSKMCRNWDIWEEERDRGQATLEVVKEFHKFSGNMLVFSDFVSKETSAGRNDSQSALSKCKESKVRTCSCAPACPPHHCFPKPHQNSLQLQTQLLEYALCSQQMQATAASYPLELICHQS